MTEILLEIWHDQSCKQYTLRAALLARSGAGGGSAGADDVDPKGKGKTKPQRENNPKPKAKVKPPSKLCLDLISKGALKTVDADSLFQQCIQNNVHSDRIAWVCILIRMTLFFRGWGSVVAIVSSPERLVNDFWWDLFQVSCYYAMGFVVGL